MRKKFKELRTLLKMNIVWVLVILYTLLLPTFLAADLSMRIVLLLSFASLISTIPATIILGYVIFFFLITTLTGHPLAAVSVQIFFYFVIYLLTEVIRPFIKSLIHKALSLVEP